MPDESTVGIAKERGSANPYHPDFVTELVQQALRLYFGNGEGFYNIVPRGAKVIIKPNLVLHFNKSGCGMECMITHPEVLVATVALVSACSPSEIIIADAPLQRCNWAEVFPQALIERLLDVCRDVPLKVLDLRRTVMAGASLAAVEKDRKPKDEYLLFDLGRESFLEQVTRDGNFRVTCYDPEQLARTHHKGRHQYLLWKEIFEADLVINLPKLKTHRKTGITGALKNLVGINGNKDFLPHHRFGGSDIGGDCYPGWHWWKHAAELYFDAANKVLGTPDYDVWTQRAESLLNLFGRYYDADVEGGWHGNDTCWRMCLDLNRCLLYGDRFGKLHNEVQRQVFHLTDAIVSGEAEGPLAPQPLRLGAVTFSGSAAYSDLAHSALLGLDYQKLSLVKGSFEPTRYPLVVKGGAPDFRTYQGSCNFDQLAQLYGQKAEPPRGWKGLCEFVITTT